MNIPPTIAAEQAMARQNVALSVIKSSAEADQAIVGILEQSARSVATSSHRGSNVNTHA